MKHPAPWRLATVLAALAGLCVGETTAPARVPHFSDYPFDQWATASARSAIKWEVRLLPPELSVHQRLIERVQAIVPGAELEKRRGRGELVLLVRFEDSDGRQWRTGSRLNLVNVQAGAKSQELTFTQAAFVKPGDYRVLVALLDTHTMEHSFTRRTLRVAPLKGDPLPEAWLGLPPVEVLPAVDGPATWFLPDVKDLLHLPVGAPGSTINEPAQPARIDLLVNITPSARSANAAGSQRRNMSLVIPALKVLSGLNAKVHPPSAAVMDLTRQRIGLETSNAAALDWSALGKVLEQTNPGVIDLKSLAVQSSMREYFAREIARRAGDAGPPRWLIVLSGPLAFGRQDDAPLPELPPDPNRHIVYLRFSAGFAGGLGSPGPGNGPPPGGNAGPGPDVQIAPPKRLHGPMPGFGTVLPGVRAWGEPQAVLPDDIERVLKPMGCEIIPVSTPEAFRKTVASLIAEISAN